MELPHFLLFQETFGEVIAGNSRFHMTETGKSARSMFSEISPSKETYFLLDTEKLGWAGGYQSGTN